MLLIIGGDIEVGQDRRLICFDALDEVGVFLPECLNTLEIRGFIVGNSLPPPQDIGSDGSWNAYGMSAPVSACGDDC